MSNVGEGEAIFEEDKPAYDPAVQRRFWFLIVILFSLHAAFLLFPVMQGIGDWADRRLLTQKFNFLFRAGETFIALAATILLLRKTNWGWMLAAISVTLRATRCLFAFVFFIYHQGFTGLALKVMAIFVAYAVLLYLINRLLIRSMYGVGNASARSALLLGASIAVVVFIFEMVEPYWRLR